MRILIVAAHPDDEVIFFWPVCQETANHEVSLLTLAHNRAKYGGGPENALREVCQLSGIRLLDLPRLETNFYRLPPRYDKPVLRDAIRSLSTSVGQAVDLVRPDLVFTHNPMGEYGHGDHRFAFNLVSQLDVPLLLTDVCLENHCHLSSPDVPPIFWRYLYRGRLLRHCVLDGQWYERMKAVYDRYDAWSWSGHPPVRQCNLYEFK